MNTSVKAATLKLAFHFETTVKTRSCKAFVEKLVWGILGACSSFSCWQVCWAVSGTEDLLCDVTWLCFCFSILYTLIKSLHPSCCALRFCWSSSVLFHVSGSPVLGSWHKCSFLRLVRPQGNCCWSTYTSEWVSALYFWIFPAVKNLQKHN